MIKEKIRQNRISERLVSVGELAAGVAHEIGNSLFIITGNTQILLTKIEKEDPRREELEIIDRVSARCAKTVGALLEYSRFSKENNKSVNINRLIESALPLIAHQSFLRHTKIKKRFAPDLPRVSVNPDQLRQVFVNLILNARDAMPQGGGLTISTRSNNSNKFMEIEFRDTGCGIPPEDIPELFNPFFTTKSEGTGLGLSICRRIIKSHKGKIEVKSKVGQGSTFVIKLPVVSGEKKIKKR
jgi:two-component system NtrC family sensor kinase